LIGVVLALGFTGSNFGIFEILSIVIMIGIVFNNAILIIVRINILKHEGVPKHKAMIQASSDRFRPILMITIAAVLGMVPLAFGVELVCGFGIASFGGIFVSGILTIVGLPLVYNLMIR